MGFGVSRIEPHPPMVGGGEARRQAAEETTPISAPTPVDGVVDAPNLRLSQTSDAAPAFAQAESPSARLHRAAAALGRSTLQVMHAFERAGLSAVDAFEVACCGVTATDAQVYLQNVLAARPSLRDYGPAMVVAEILGRLVGEGQTAAPNQIAERWQAHEKTRVLRPDGYLVSGRTGAPLVHLTSNDRGPGAANYELGRLYVQVGSVMYPRQSDGAPDRDRPRATFVPLDPLLLGHVLNGFEGAIVGVAEGVAQILTDPVQTVHDLGRLPQTVADLLAASPELLERFTALPLGAQVEAVSDSSSPRPSPRSGWAPRRRLEPSRRAPPGGWGAASGSS